jgi:hypothetical protein
MQLTQSQTRRSVFESTGKLLLDHEYSLIEVEESPDSD